MKIVATIFMLTKLCRCWLTTFEFTNLIVTSNNWNMLSTTNQSKTNRPVFFSKSKYPSIIISRCWLKLFNWTFLLLSSFSISTNPRASPNCQVSRQTIFFSATNLRGVRPARIVVKTGISSTQVLTINDFSLNFKIATVHRLHK